MNWILFSILAWRAIKGVGWGCRKRMIFFLIVNNIDFTKVDKGRGRRVKTQSFFCEYNAVLYKPFAAKKVKNSFINGQEKLAYIQNKPGVQATGLDAFPCNSIKKQNPAIKKIA